MELNQEYCIDCGWLPEDKVEYFKGGSHKCLVCGKVYHLIAGQLISLKEVS